MNVGSDLRGEVLHGDGGEERYGIFSCLYQEWVYKVSGKHPSQSH